jgi:hypothetical protein
MWVSSSVFLVVALLSAGALAAEPATQPTTRPAAKAPIPKDWLTIENKANHFKYRVPPQWKTRQSSDTVTVLDLPEPKARNAMDLQVGSFMAIAGPCHAVKIEDDAKEFRTSLQKDYPRAKLVKDEAIELGGRPAWLFVFDSPTSVKVVGGRRGGPQTTTEIKKSLRTYEINAVQGTIHCYISFTADPTTYGRELAAVQHVMDSLEWTN